MPTSVLAPKIWCIRQFLKSSDILKTDGRDDLRCYDIDKGRIPRLIEVLDGMPTRLGGLRSARPLQT